MASQRWTSTISIVQILTMFKWMVRLLNSSAFSSISTNHFDRIASLRNSHSQWTIFIFNLISKLKENHFSLTSLLKHTLLPSFFRNSKNRTLLAWSPVDLSFSVRRYYSIITKPKKFYSIIHHKIASFTFGIWIESDSY